MNNKQECFREYFGWDGLFSNKELEIMLEMFSKNTTREATVLKGKDEVVDTKNRITNIKFYSKNDDTQWIINKLDWAIREVNKKFYCFDITSFNSFQYAEYYANNGGKYDWHSDSHLCSSNDKFGNTSGNTTRKLTLCLLLNDDFEGGEFEISCPNNKVDFKKGRLIIFPSVVRHKVNPVTVGVRKSLVVWMQGPNFR